MRKAHDIATDLLGSPDGATVSAVVGVPMPTEGYSVGQFGTSGNASDLDVEGWVKSVLPYVAFHSNHYLGIWTDPETGVVYLDVVRIHSELIPACRDAKARKELAIFDLRRMATIFADDYATVGV